MGGASPIDENPGGGDAAGEWTAWRAFIANQNAFHALSVLEEAYQRYGREPNAVTAFGALRALIRWGRLNGISIDHLAIAAVLGRVDGDAESPFQLVIKRRKPTPAERERQKLANAKRRRSMTKLHEQELFYRALLHREATGESLVRCFEAVASATDRGAYRNRRVGCCSYGKVEAAYHKWIARFRAAGVSEIKYGPDDAIQTISLRAKGRPKKA
jgi:hypothetical protein